MEKRPMRMRSRKGFSLIEILIAIVVLAIGIMGVLGALAYGVKAGEYSSRTTKATNLSRRLLERLLVDQAWTGGVLKGNEPHFDPQDQSTWTPVDASPYNNLFMDAGDRNQYYREITYTAPGVATPGLNVVDKVVTGSSWENERLARITVNIHYFDKNGVHKTVTTWAYSRK